MIHINRILFMILSTVIVLTACSKSENKTDKKVPPASAKVVDLAENDDSDKNDDSAKKGDAPSARDARKRSTSNRPAVANRRSRPSADKDKPASDAPENPKEHLPKDAKTEETAKADDKGMDTSGNTPDNADTFDFATDSAEDEPTERIVKKREGLNIENVINIRELREQTGYVGALSQTDLVGQPSDARYNVIRLSTDKPSELGFAVQVWKPGNESAASKRFEEIYKQSFGGVKQKEIATDAFQASHHGMTELGFYDKAKRAVVLISCSQSVCKAEHLKSIATTIQRRL